MRAPAAAKGAFVNYRVNLRWWRDRVVPFAVEFVGTDFEGGDLVILDFDAFWIGVGVDLGSDLQSGLGRGGGDELHDGLIADQRSPK